MRAAVVSFDRDAFVEELLDISAADEGADDERRSTIEELEWISNKDAFPALETFLHIARDELFQKGSPISVLENSSVTLTTDNSSDGCDSNVNWGRLGVPVRTRSKCARKRRLNRFGEIPASWEKDLCRHPIKVWRSDTGRAKIGGYCLHCGAEKTPQWRAGPCGPKTLCNACGVRYKSGRLVPEYRPASSPTFSSKLHSNSHRKIIEMRKVNGEEWRRARKNSCD